jgi:ACT domain-containing protein
MNMKYGTWNARTLFGTGLLMTVTKGISKYKLDFVGVQEVRWDRGGTKQQVNIHFSIEREMRITNYVQLSFST